MIPYLPFYDAAELPSEMSDMMLGDIIKLAVERNRLLHTLDVIDLQEETKTNYSQVKQLLLDTKIYGQNSEEERQKDLLSHYFVRLAYLKTKVMRDWFVRHESLLFRVRLRWKLLGNEQDRALFLQDLLLGLCQRYPESLFPYEIISARNLPYNLGDDEKAYLQGKWPTAEVFVKVPFEYAARYISKHIGLVSGGSFFMIIDYVDSLLEQFFQRHLEEMMRKDKEILPFIAENHEELYEFYDVLSKDHLNATTIDYDSETNPNSINLANLEKSTLHFPLCMIEIHRHVRLEHHLKNKGRWQYGSFLKAIGLSLQGALKFWKGEFTKVMTEKEFENGYTYNFRYLYGEEGQKKDWKAQSCATIIKGASPNSGECHGCPFKEYSTQNLREVLKSNFKIAPQLIETIVLQTQRKKYQLACKQVYGATHHNAKYDKEVGFHPVNYFKASLKENQFEVTRPSRMDFRDAATAQKKVKTEEPVTWKDRDLSGVKKAKFLF